MRTIFKLSRLKLSRLSRFYLLLMALPATSLAGTITVQPGSCVNVSGQEICSPSTPGAGNAKMEVTYSCRYGAHKSGDLPGYKTYALIKVITDSSGKSSEVFVKDFGMKGKAKCEQAVDDRSK